MTIIFSKLKKIKFKTIGLFAIFWGFLIGLQQSSTIIISSIHDLEQFPYLSLVSIGFLIVLAVLLEFVFLFLASFINNKEEIIFSAGAFGWIFIFLYFKFSAVAKNAFVLLGLVFVSMVFSFILGTIYYCCRETFKRKKNVLLKRAVNVFNYFLLGSFFIASGFILFNVIIRLHGRRLGFAFEKESQKDENGPNIILITTDALRADYFNKETMPNVFEIINDSVLFENAYAPSPWTLPSFSSIMSGKPPGEIGVSVYETDAGKISSAHKLDKSFLTLAEYLSLKGYLTQAVLTNKYLTGARGFSQGFDGFLNLEERRPYHWHFHLKNMALVRLGQKVPILGKNLKPAVDFLVGETSEDAFKTRAGQVVDNSIHWLENVRQEPFLLWIHFIDPHGPYNPPENYMPELYLEKEKQNKLRAYDMKKEDIRWREKDIQALEKLYRSDVIYHDREIGRLINNLRENGLYNDSLIFFTSDHGEEFFEHGKLGHGYNLYDEEAKIPLVIKLAKNERGGEKIENPVNNIDLFATILSIIEKKDGNKNNLLGSNYREKIYISGNRQGPEMEAIVSGDYKLIWDKYSDSLELYDLAKEEEKENQLDHYKQGAESLEKDLIQYSSNNKEKFEQHLQSGFEKQKNLGDVVGY